MLLSVVAGGGALASAATAHADVAPRTALCVINCGGGVQGSGNLVSHGGPVETSSTNYLIFWGAFPNTTVNVACPTCSALPPLPDPDYEGLISSFFHNVGGTSYYGMLGQYGASNSSQVGGEYVDNLNPYPVNTSATVQDSDIQAEVRRAEAVNGWTGGLGHNFFVMLAPGETECAPSLGCSGTDFCGYHETESDLRGAQTPYEVIPFPENPSLSGLCTVGQSPNGDPAADDAVNIISHELFETVTDPDLTAWWDGAGYEIGDKCAWTFGNTGLTGSNVTLHGVSFIVQLEYSNRISNCSLS
jgi:hypothetical protein